MTDGEDEANQFPLIHRQGSVAWRHRAAKERHRVLTLQKNSSKTVSRGITLHQKGLCEIRKGEDGHRCDSSLEGGERSSRVVILGEPVLAKEGRERGSDRPELLDELAVVAREA